MVLRGNLCITKTPSSGFPSNVTLLLPGRLRLTQPPVPFRMSLISMAFVTDGICGIHNTKRGLLKLSHFRLSAGSRCNIMLDLAGDGDGAKPLPAGSAVAKRNCSPEVLRYGFRGDERRSGRVTILRSRERMTAMRSLRCRSLTLSFAIARSARMSSASASSSKSGSREPLLGRPLFCGS
jgi:hypothetical protein